VDVDVIARREGFGREGAPAAKALVARAIRAPYFMTGAPAAWSRRAILWPSATASRAVTVSTLPPTRTITSSPAERSRSATATPSAGSIAMAVQPAVISRRALSRRLSLRAS
jgi:hypothetical protein